MLKQRYCVWLIIAPRKSRRRRQGNQPPNATSYPQTPICKGGHHLPFHPIGSLQLTNLAPSALAFVAERDQVPVSGSARSLSQELSPGTVFPPSTLLFLRLSIPRPIEPPTTHPHSQNIMSTRKRKQEEEEEELQALPSDESEEEEE